MRILEVTNHFHPCIGGMENVVLNLSLGLKKLGHEVSVACLNKCAYSSEKLPEGGKAEKINILRLPFTDLKYYKIAFGVLGPAKKHDIIHVHGIGFFSDFLIVTKPLHRKPVVVSTHGGIFHTQKISFIKKIYFYLAQRILLDFADAVVAVSRSDAPLFRKICRKVVLIENGVEVEKFMKAKGKKLKNSFLFVGRLSRNKEIENLLKTFLLVAEKEKNAKLFIAGEDWEGIGSKLKALSENLGLGERVFFEGKVSDKRLFELFAQSEFFVSASRYEGFGISAVEAMAAGCIPLLNTIRAFEELVGNGVNGFLIDFTKAETAATEIAAITRLPSEEKKRIAENAIASARKFSWKEKTRQYEALFREFGDYEMGRAASVHNTSLLGAPQFRELKG